MSNAILNLFQELMINSHLSIFILDVNWFDPGDYFGALGLGITGLTILVGFEDRKFVEL